MSRRKIIVNDIEYKYSIGKTHTKIDGIGSFLNTDIGSNVFVEHICECCGQRYSEIYNGEPKGKIVFSVKPSDIKRKIESK